MNPILHYELGKGRAAFISVWDTTRVTGSVSNNTSVTLPFIGAGVYKCRVDWGDGVVTTIDSALLGNQLTANTHDYLVQKLNVTIKITGICNGWSFNNGGDKTKILEVKTWGKLKPLGLGFMYGCTNLILDNVKDLLDWSSSTTMINAFQDCANLVTINRINEWNISTITIMNSLFQGCNKLTQDLNTVGGFGSKMGGVTNIGSMLNGCAAYNQNVNRWNTVGVTAMSAVFSGCTLFNNGFAPGDPGTSGGMLWNTAAVNTGMNSMFTNCSSFNQALPFSGNIWKVTAVTSMANTFQNCIRFNQDLNTWTPNACLSFNLMFSGCSVFNNGDSGNNAAKAFTWTTPLVNNLGSMFANCIAFNQKVNTFNVSAVTTFASMFVGCTIFNNGSAAPGGGSQDDGANPINWILASTGSIACNSMFNGCKAYNQPMNTNGSFWITTRITNMSNMFASCDIFNKPLFLWNTALVTNMGNMFNAAKKFNQNVNTNSNPGAGTTINSWKITIVTNFTSMFDTASEFNNGSLTNDGLNPLNWVSGTTNFTCNTMFSATDKFNQNVNLFQPNKATVMNGMFGSTKLFNNGEIGNTGSNALTWFSSNVTTYVCTNMNTVFSGAIAFNQPIRWNTVAVVQMTQMFNTASAFNQNINTGSSVGLGGAGDGDNIWNVSNIGVGNLGSMSQMLLSAIAFNNGGQPFNGWRPINVQNMGQFMTGTAIANTNIGLWNPINCTNFGGFLNKTPTSWDLTSTNAIYNGWTNYLLQASASPGLIPLSIGSVGSGPKYDSSGAEGRALLTRPVLSGNNVTIVSGTGGVFRISTGTVHGLVDGNKVYVNGVTNYPTANGGWIIKASGLGGQTFELVGSTFAGSGTVTGTTKFGYSWTVTDGGHNINDQLVANYSLNSIVTDSTGLSPTASANNITYTPGITGNAAVFAGNNFNFIDVPDTNNFSFVAGTGIDDLFSISVWVRFSAFSSLSNEIINKMGDLGVHEWRLTYTSGKIQFTKHDRSFNTSIFQGVAANNTISLNTWYNITVTDNGTKTVAGMKIYINGVLATVTDISAGTYTGMVNTASAVRIGQLAYGTVVANNAHNGYIEDIYIWKSKTLTAADATYLYGGGAGRGTYPLV